MAIQHRRGSYLNFDPSKMKPGELAVVQDKDPSSSDGKRLYLCTGTSAGSGVKKLAFLDELKTYDDDAKDAANQAANAAASITSSLQTVLDAKQIVDQKADEIEHWSKNGGFTFIPQVSSDGVLSWTNLAGMENPEPVNIKGQKGDTGARISSVTSLFARSNSGTTPPTDFSTTIPTLTNEYPYLWIKDRYMLTNKSIFFGSERVGAVLGQQGSQGVKGDPGAALTAVYVYYYRSSSSVAPTTTDGFSTTLPTLTSSYRYLWAYEEVVRSDGVRIPTPIHLMAVYGNSGATGANGVGISSMVTKYYQSSSSSTPAYNSSSWSTSVPFPTAGYYIHTQTITTMTDGSVNYSYQKIRNGMNGSSPTVVNNLTSTNTSSALSAYQGKVLADRVTSLENSSGSSGSGVIVDTTYGAYRTDTTLGDNVLAALRKGQLPVVYESSCYRAVVQAELSYVCVGYQINLTYMSGTCGGSPMYSTTYVQTSHK